MLSNRKLTYSKVFIDSQERLPQSNSSSDFIIELNEVLETFPNTVMYVMDEVIPQSYFTTPEGFYQYFYLILYKTSTGEIERFCKIDVKNQVFFASQLIANIITQLNALNSDIQADLFTSSYDSDQRNAVITITLNTFSFKIPTDEELQGMLWHNTTPSDPSYIIDDPMSINKLIGNYEIKQMTNSTWTSGLFNLNPFNSVYIICSELSDYHYSAPSSYSNAIVKKINMMFNVGGVTVNSSAPLLNDYIDVSNRSFKRLRFRITDARGKTINFHGQPISFSLLFVNL